MRGLRGTIAGCAAAAIIVAAGSAAFANNKDPFDSNASATGGLAVADAVSLGTSSNGRTTQDGSSSHASAFAVRIGDVEISPVQSCDASSQAGESGVSNQRSSSLQTIGEAGDPASIAVLGSSCYAQAQSNNNTHARADASLLAMSWNTECYEEEAPSCPVPDHGAATVFGTHTETATTSGQANSADSFTAASASAGDTSVTVLRCNSESLGTKDGATSSSEATFIESGETSAGAPVDCSAGQSAASFEQG